MPRKNKAAAPQPQVRPTLLKLSALRPPKISGTLAEEMRQVSQALQRSPLAGSLRRFAERAPFSELAKQLGNRPPPADLRVWLGRSTEPAEQSIKKQNGGRRYRTLPRRSTKCSASEKRTLASVSSRHRLIASKQFSEKNIGICVADSQTQDAPAHDQGASCSKKSSRNKANWRALSGRRRPGSVRRTTSSVRFCPARKICP